MTETYLSLWKPPIPRRLVRCSRAADAIVRDVAATYGLTAEQIIAPTRRREIAWPRQHVMWALAQEQRYSLPTIARRLGLKDHTTVLHGVREHAKRMGQGA